MRSVAYGIAILAAAGIVYFISNSPTEPAGGEAETGISASAETVTPDGDVQTASLTLDVPKMHCPVMCYPSVKKTLEQRDDVMAVELAPQKEEGVIDNPQVIVTFTEGFDRDQAIASLDSAGFPGSTVAEK